MLHLHIIIILMKIIKMHTVIHVSGNIYPKRYSDMWKEISKKISAYPKSDGYQPSHIRIRYPNYTIRIQKCYIWIGADIRKKLTDRIIGLFGQPSTRIIFIPFTPLRGAKQEAALFIECAIGMVYRIWRLESVVDECERLCTYCSL